MIEQSLKKVLGFGVKEFVEKAIAGGWMPVVSYGSRLNWMKRFYLLPSAHEAVVFVARDDGDQPPLEELSWKIAYAVILLDPRAWLAVGKTEGWGERTHTYWTSENGGFEETAKNAWEHKMHDMIAELIDTLAEEV